MHSAPLYAARIPACPICGWAPLLGYYKDSDQTPEWPYLDLFHLVQAQLSHSVPAPATVAMVQGSWAARQLSVDLLVS